jgi:hypothetical protein
LLFWRLLVMGISLRALVLVFGLCSIGVLAKPTPSAQALGEISSQALQPPSGLNAVTGTANPVFSWDSVEGAAMYRVAVFPDAGAGKPNPSPLAAVWVEGNTYAYGQGRILELPGALKNRRPEPLKPDLSYRWMVASARKGGAGKSAWASAKLAPWQSGVLAEPTPVDVSGTSANAGAAALRAQPSEDMEVKTLLPSALEDASHLLQKGQIEQAQAAFLLQTQKEPQNPRAWKGLGDSYLAGNMLLEAMEAYQKTRALDPDDKEVEAWIKAHYRPR